MQSAFKPQQTNAISISRWTSFTGKLTLNQVHSHYCVFYVGLELECTHCRSFNVTRAGPVFGCVTSTENPPTIPGTCATSLLFTGARRNCQISLLAKAAATWRPRCLSGRNKHLPGHVFTKMRCASVSFVTSQNDACSACGL